MSFHRPPFEVEKKKREIKESILWKWMFSYLKPFKSLIIFLSMLLFAFTIIETYIPRFQEWIIDRGILGGDWAYAFDMIILWLALFLISAIGNMFVNYYFGKLGQEIIYNMRNDVFKHLQKISLGYFDTHHSGDVISIATNDIDQINIIMGGQLIQIIMDLIKGVFIVVLMFIINVELALLSMILVPIFLVFSSIFKRKVKSAFRETRKQMSNVTQKAQENISGMKVIKSYGKEDRAAEEFDDANKQSQVAMLRIRKIFAFYFPLIMFVTSIFSAIVLLYAGVAIQDGISIFGSVISIGTFMVFNGYLNQFFQPLFAITMFQQFTESALASAERIYKLITEDTEIPNPSSPKSFENVKGSIEFKNVDFSYPKRKVKMEGKSINELYTDNFDNKNGKIPAKRMRKMPEGMQGKMPEGMQGKMPEGMQGKMPEGMQGMMQMMDFKDPKILLKMANDLDSQIHGVSAGKISQGGEGGGMGGNGGDTGKGMPQKMVLGILSSPMIPKDVSEQFSPSVKLLIDEHKKLQIHNASSGEVFNNLSFKISAGKTIAIVGETGAGKTTLIKLLPRFYDIQSGEIMVDGINVKDILKEDLRSIIGMVPQDSFLFSDTIMNNLYYGVNDDVMRDGLQDELIRISEFLGLNNFVQKMPLKYDTKLLENASNISVGQRQLIAFARVLMLDPRILILDEATSSVDPYTETLIQDALDKARKGRTTIIIAHRLSTIKNADEIFVIENGNIIERGSHNELMSKNGAYAKLVKMQESNS